MTATFVFLQADRVILLNDAAVLGEDGKLLDVGSKVAAFPDLNLAVAYQGYCHPRWIEQRLRRIAPRSVQEAVNALPAILLDIAALNRRSGRKDPKLRFLVIAFDKDHGPAAWMAFSRRDFMPEGYIPGQLIRIRGYHDAVPDVEALFGRPVDTSDPASFDPVGDGLVMMQAARHAPYPEGWYGVGGYVEIITFGLSGMDREIIHEWPEDIVGEPIRPIARAA